MATPEAIILDSSVVIAHFRNKLNIFDHITPNDHLFIPLVVLGELYKGAKKSKNTDKNLAMIEKLLQFVGILYPDSATAEQYADISVALEAQGTPIPENDIWIAATA